MKKMALVVIVTCFLLLLTGCGEDSSSNTEELEVTVTRCDLGEFKPNHNYLNIANMYQNQNMLSEYNTYKQLAQIDGKYEYVIQFIVDEETHSVTRDSPYSVGQTITVTYNSKKNTYE